MPIPTQEIIKETNDMIKYLLAISVSLFLIGRSCAQTVFENVCKIENLTEYKAYSQDGIRFRSCWGGWLTNGEWTGTIINESSKNYYFLIREPGAVDGKATFLLSAKGDSPLFPRTAIRSVIIESLVDCAGGRKKKMLATAYAREMGVGGIVAIEQFDDTWMPLDEDIIKFVCLKK